MPSFCACDRGINVRIAFAAPREEDTHFRLVQRRLGAGPERCLEVSRRYGSPAYNVQTTHIPPRPIPLKHLYLPPQIIHIPRELLKRRDRPLQTVVVHREREVEDLGDEVWRWG